MTVEGWSKTLNPVFVWRPYEFLIKYGGCWGGPPGTEMQSMLSSCGNAGGGAEHAAKRFTWEEKLRIRKEACVINCIASTLTEKDGRQHG